MEYITAITTKPKVKLIPRCETLPYKSFITMAPVPANTIMRTSKTPPNTFSDNPKDFN